MQIHVDIEKHTETCLVRIKADPQTTDELQEILRCCKGYAPRAKVLGVF